MKFLKPGYRTSEFWIHGAISALLWGISIVNTQQMPVKFAIGVQVVNSGLYMLSRGIAKSSSSMVHVSDTQSGSGTTGQSEITKVGIDPPSKAY